jgi:hypothetical protein
MLSWLPWVTGTFVLSTLVAYGFLRLRCRGIGPPFGPRARGWAISIIMIVAAISTGFGIALAAVVHAIEAVAISPVLCGGLWFAKIPPQRDLDMRPRKLTALPTLPFSRLYEEMGEDMQAWCDIRVQAARARPRYIADAVSYYYDQVVGKSGLSDPRHVAVLRRWRDSITHKIAIVRLISLNATPARLRASLQAHPSTQRAVYPDNDPPRLARRLKTEALNELHLFLAYVYRLGYHKLLIYPFRPTVFQPSARRAESTAPDL